MSADSATSAETDADAETETQLPIGRFGRLLSLIAAVTAVFLFVANQTLPPGVFSIAVVAIGSIAVITATTGFLISVASYVGGGR
jgi:hypothetical protein